MFRGSQDIMDAAWFRPINFVELYNKQVIPCIDNNLSYNLSYITKVILNEFKAILDSAAVGSG